MAEVVLSGAIRSNLLSIQNTAKLLDQTQLRLSTGLKVNSAIDDPTAFFTARSLNTRASDLNRLLDAMGQGIQTIRAADEGIQSITRLIETAKATANSALETQIIPSKSQGPLNAITNQTLALTAAFSSIASTEQITIAVGTGTPLTVTVGAKTVSQFVSAINGLTGISAQIAGGALRIEGDNGDALIVTSTVGSIATDLGVSGTFANGTNRDSFEADYNELLNQIDQLAQDAIYKGVNLLNGDDLTINFNEAQTSQLTVGGVTFTHTDDLNIPDIPADDWATDANIRTAVSGIDAATRLLRNQAATFGSNLGVVEIRQDFTKNLINTLETGAADLTLADTNEEGANMLALQTRQQLGSVALSLASQADQNVLRLF